VKRGNGTSLRGLFLAALILGALSVAGLGRGWVAGAFDSRPDPHTMVTRLVRFITDFKASFWAFVFSPSPGEDVLQGER